MIKLTKRRDRRATGTDSAEWTVMAAPQISLVNIHEVGWCAIYDWLKRGQRARVLVRGARTRANCLADLATTHPELLTEERQWVMH